MENRARKTLMALEESCCAARFISPSKPGQLPVATSARGGFRDEASIGSKRWTAEFSGPPTHRCIDRIEAPNHPQFCLRGSSAVRTSSHRAKRLDYRPLAGFPLGRLHDHLRFKYGELDEGSPTPSGSC